MSAKQLTPWEALQKFPPYYVRMLAKAGHATALSDADIAIASGIDINRIREIKVLTRWDSVTVAELLGYTIACNFDPMNSLHRARVKKYDYTWKRRNITPFNYLRKSPKWESELLPIFMILQAELKRQSSAA